MVTTLENLTDTERSQLERKELAKGSWRQGQVENALIVLNTILGEEMTPRVAAEILVTEACFVAEGGDFPASLESLSRAALFIESATLRVQGSFYHQRARAHKELGDIDAALTDYGGAVARWEEAGDREYEGMAALNVAGIYLGLGDLPRCSESLNKALMRFAETNSPYLSQAYDTEANLRLVQGQIETAMISISKALDLVGENDLWRQTFLITKDKIELKLLSLLGVKTVDDFTRLQTGMLRRVLLQGKTFSQAGEILGLTRKGVDYLVWHKKELEEFRKVRRIRRKTLFRKD